VTRYRPETSRLQLIEAGTPLDIEDAWGSDPLSFAVTKSSADIVQMLLATNTVDVNARDDHDRTPLLYAAAYGFFEMSKLLLDHGSRHRYVDRYGESPLLAAQLGGHTEVVNFLLGGNTMILEATGE
jgi:ankyrin repeat protein